ncbi:MAG: hypothetical protein V4850_22285 [Myxococcota bacterium]
MASPSHPFRILAAVMVGWVMLPVGLLGVVGVVSDEGPMRPAWGMMVVGCVLGVGGAVSTVWDAWQVGKVERARLAGVRSSVTTRSADVALARWQVDVGEARAFSAREWASRKVEVAGGALGLLVLGAALVWLTKDAPPGAAVATGALLGGLYLVIGLGKYGLEYVNAQRDTGEVAVFADSVFVLGSWHALAGDRQLTRVALVPGALELTVRWQTRGGPASDTIRVPVPEGARAVAEEATAVLARRVVSGV